MRTSKYSAYDNYTVSEVGGNISSVLDKLVRLTAKITEHYASDILFPINALQDAIEKREPLYRVLGFRECGVNSFKSVEELSGSHDSYIQFWELKFVPGEDLNRSGDVTTLVRVCVSKD